MLILKNSSSAKKKQTQETVSKRYKTFWKNLEHRTHHPKIGIPIKSIRNKKQNSSKLRGNLKWRMGT